MRIDLGGKFLRGRNKCNSYSGVRLTISQIRMVKRQDSRVFNNFKSREIKRIVCIKLYLNLRMRELQIKKARMK